ncbi:SGNH hydrolase-type esterase domain-containing protein [Cytidiella melzeri]|nr:SGNH hydrolase-type esterase domain-containing protein [Cytidiella melzeri]
MLCTILSGIVAISSLIFSAVALPQSASSPAVELDSVPSSIHDTVDIHNPQIHYHGRWDNLQGTWWAGSGLKLHVNNLQTLTLNLGPHTTSPLTSVGVSVDYGSYTTVNVSAGANAIPLPTKKGSGDAASVVRITTEGWQDNRMQLESIDINRGAILESYTPSQIRFQVIGDSLSAGQYLPQGVLQAWPVLTTEFLKAELNVNAQPGAALKDIPAWGNVHGVSYEFFKTEDTGYYYTTDHNYTTPWDFSKDQPAPTHIVIHIGANDASQNVTSTDFEQTYLTFVTRLRTIYHTQPILVFTPWGWPASDGSISYYYPGSYSKIVNDLHALGDENVFLVNTTGWIRWQDVFPDNTHPTVEGHQRIAGFFEEWLAEWGLKPQASWPTQP